MFVVFSLAVGAGENFPTTEDEWYAELQKTDKDNINYQHRKIALMLKVIHMRIDKITTELQILEPNIDQLPKLKNELHTWEWVDRNAAVNSIDQRLEDVFTLADNLYLRIQNLSRELPGIQNYNTEYTDSENVNTTVNVNQLQKIITKAVQNSVSSKKNWKERWKGNF